jgi:hypothetical protein
MTYRYTSVNVLEDELGHRVEVSGRTNIRFTFLDREILVSSEVLCDGCGIAIYRDWSKLVTAGNGDIYISSEEVETAVGEIARALQDVGTAVEIV